MSATPTTRKRQPLKLLGALTLLLLLAYIGISIFVAAKLTRTTRKELTHNPAALGFAVEEVSFTSADDGLTLRGWLLRPAAPSDRLVIMVHGWNGVRDQSHMLDIARGLNQSGFGVLSFDLRGHGQSEGERFSLGWFERRDIHGAIAFGRAQGFKQIGLLGFSMGGATALMAAAESPEVRAVISDSAYADLEELLGRQLPAQSGLPSFFNPGILTMVRLLYGPDVEQIRPIDDVRRLSPRPLLIMHGVDDSFIPLFNAEKLRDSYNSSGGTAGYETFPGARHVALYESDPERYMRLVTGFFSHAMPPGPEARSWKLEAGNDMPCFMLHASCFLVPETFLRTV